MTERISQQTRPQTFGQASIARTLLIRIHRHRHINPTAVPHVGTKRRPNVLKGTQSHLVEV